MGQGRPVTLLDEMAPWRLEQVWTERDKEPQMIEGHGVSVTDFHPDSSRWMFTLDFIRWVTTSGHLRFQLRWTGEPKRVFPLMLMVRFAHMPRVDKCGMPLEEQQGEVTVGLMGLIVETGIYDVYRPHTAQFNGERRWCAFPTFFSRDEFVGATASEIAAARLKGPLAHPVGERRG